MATTIRIPIDLRNPRVQSLAGNSYFNVIAMTNYDLGYWNFVKSVDGKIYGFVEIPKNVNATPNGSIVLTIGANATSGVTVWNVSYAVIQNNAGAMDASLTSIGAQNITVPGTARNTDEITFTLGGGLTAGYLLLVEIFHNGASGSETLAVDSELYDAQLQIDTA